MTKFFGYSKVLQAENLCGFKLKRRKKWRKEILKEVHMNLLSLNLTETIEKFKKINLPSYRAKQVFAWARKFTDFDNMSDLPKDLRARLKEHFTSILLASEKELVSKDGTVKYLFKLNDNNLIETVLLKQSYGNTLCISTQVGCRMGCVFCQSGANGLIRNLTAGEIHAQAVAVNALNGGNLENRKITNIVLMGIGEPLDNFDNTVKFLRLIGEESGLNISMRNITVSTCGLKDKIIELADLNFQCNLALSLHSPFDKIRKQIMPIANKYTVLELTESLKYYFEKTKRRVLIEYALIDNLNNRQEDAEELKNLLKDLCCHINLINLNENKNLKGVSDEKALEFLTILQNLGLSVTMRKKSGSDIEGACGQLKSKFVKDSDAIGRDSK